MRKLTQKHPSEMQNDSILARIVGIAKGAAMRAKYQSDEEIDNYIKDRSDRLISIIQSKQRFEDRRNQC